MADFKYIMQGFQKDINFFDEIKEVLETEDYTSIWILTAFVNERAICNLMPSIKKSKADISFIIGIRNNVSTYQALKCLINMKVSVFVFDTARIESIFHAKSAFSDIIGQVCKCRTMGSASFLNDNRFRKMPKNLASDYIAEIKWKDGHLERKGLDVNEFETVIEDAQYLPQKYIEDVCNDIGNIFQEEIDKVIYSYVDRTERGSAANLAELVKNKSQMIQIEMEGVYKEIERLNECIIRLERKKTSQYRLLIVDSLKKYQEILERHEKNKPQEIKKPDEKEENIQYQEKLKEIDKEITELNQKVEQNRDELTKINEAIGETEQIIAKLRVLRSEFGDIKEELNVYLKKYQLEIKEDFCLKDPLEIIEQYKNKLITDKTIKQLTLNGKGVFLVLFYCHIKAHSIVVNSW